jgi:two-component system response regulator GlrR
MGARIMVIDDDLDTLEVMRDILVGEGYDVVVATGADETLTDVVAAAPDVVVVDLLLSSDQRGLSGWDVVRLIKAHRLIHDLEVLVVSADYPTLRSHIPEAASMDGVRLLTKPFTLESLSVLVRDALRERNNPFGIGPFSTDGSRPPLAGSTGSDG